MENMQKVVTAEDLAKVVGCSKCSVAYAFAKSEKTKKHISKELKEEILKVAGEIGYDPQKAQDARHALRVEKRTTPTIFELSQAVGCSASSVNNVFLGTRKVSEELKERVLKKAEELGFVYHPYLKPDERIAFKAAEKERKFSLRYAGFKNREEQDEYMLAMRSTGHSNAQISRKVGLAIQTVRRRIGTQPEDMTRDNRVAGMKHYAAENQRRRIYVDTHLVRTYNNMILECGQLRSQAAELVSKADELTKEITKMKPQVEKAKLSTEKLAEMPAEQLQMSVSPTFNAVLQ